MNDILEGEENLGENPGQIPLVDPQIEERAKMQGWSPKEDFRGDPSNWRPADEFVRRADEMMPIMKSVNKRLEGQVNTLKDELSETKGMVSKMVKVQEKYSGDLYETKITDIRAKKREAAKSEDWETYDRLEGLEMQTAKPEPAKPDPPANANHVETVHPEVERWIGENNWFGNDREMTDYAAFIGEQLKINNDPLAQVGNEYAFCEKVKRQVQSTFPNKFQNKSRGHTDVDEPNLRGSENTNPSGKTTYNDLPKDAKEHCKQMLRDIPNFTKEKYLKDYFEEE